VGLLAGNGGPGLINGDGNATAANGECYVLDS